MSKNPPASVPGDYGLRVALAFGDAIVHEAMSVGRGKITVGHREGCTFVLPTVGTRKTMARQVLVKGTELFLLDAFDGRVYRGGTPTDLATLHAEGQGRIKLQPEDWALLWLRDQPGIRVVVQRVRGEALPRMPREGMDKPLLMTTLLSAVAFGIFMVVSFLRYDPDRPQLELEDLDSRFAKAMFNYPPEEEEPPEEKPEVSDEDKPEEKARKRAGGPEGKFGRPDRTGPSNIPRNPDETMTNVPKVGLVKELDTLAQTDTMKNLLAVGGEIGGLDDGELVVGGGNYGMSTRGGGAGGGGEGEGTIHGTGDVDVGGSGVANRRRQVKGTGKPKEKEVSVKTGNARVKGQLSKELIDREVRRHRAQVRFCYTKQLTRFPNISGKVMLSWIIGMDGSVNAPKVKSSSLGNKDAESCMVRALSSWHFPKPQGGVVQVDYPFIFAPK